jgi:hypothetical protein
MSGDLGAFDAITEAQDGSTNKIHFSAEDVRRFHTEYMGVESKGLNKAILATMEWKDQDGNPLPTYPRRRMFDTAEEFIAAWYTVEELRLKLGRDWFIASAIEASRVLIAVLAARNVVKHVSKKTHLGPPARGSKFRGADGTIYLSSTRLSLPAEMECEGEGTKKRSHFRRGHIHTVAVGHGRGAREKRWFEPVFVNADPDFVTKLQRYKVAA